MKHIKCNHEKICQECVQQEIKKHEEAIVELRKKLPNNTNVYQGGWILTSPVYPVNNPNLHYHGQSPCYNNPCVWC